jgi:hypothetical protein
MLLALLRHQSERHRPQAGSYKSGGDLLDDLHVLDGG